MTKLNAFLIGTAAVALVFLLTLLIYAGMVWVLWAFVVWGGAVSSPPTLFGCFAIGAALAIVRSLLT